MGALLLPLAADLGAARSQMAFTRGFHIVPSALALLFTLDQRSLLEEELEG